MKLKELRKQINLTQPQAASIVGIPFRTYCRYEDENKYEGSFKYKQIISILVNYSNNVVLSLDNIKSIVTEVFSNYHVESCYLFGSYAKGKATPQSDIDLMIVSDVEGIKFYQLNGDLETKLNKKVDLLTSETATQNIKLMNEILKDGIKVYG